MLQNQERADPMEPPMDTAVAVDIIMDAFTAAKERKIEVGDRLEIYIVDKTGVSHGHCDLKQD
jgi:20S proteasome alpha/beta subunit